jgi:hypothetical protein
MSQTTVSAGGAAIGNAGDIADSGPVDVVSGFQQDTSQMPFGFGVRAGTARDWYKLATGFSSVLPVSGILIRRANYQQQITLPNGQTIGDAGASGLVTNAPLNILRKGRILVPVEGVVAYDQRAWCRGIATGTSALGTPGIWGATSYSVANNDTTPSYHVNTTRQAVFRSASFTAADGTTLVAVLEVDFTNSAV